VSDGKMTFYVPHRLALSIIFSAMWVPLLFLYQEITMVLIMMVLVNIGLIILGINFVSRISISSTGIELYLVNKLKWSEVADAKAYSIFGLKYLRIKRQKGWPWSLPLYFVGSSSVTNAIKTYAPVNNPIHQVVTIENGS